MQGEESVTGGLLNREDAGKTAEELELGESIGHCFRNLMCSFHYLFRKVRFL